jgi:hypothetical protein
MTLWKEDGTPVREHPACPFCDADAVESEFGDARCRSCHWKGELADLLEADIRRRPGANLLSFLATRNISLTDFAVHLWGGGRVAALANVRKYIYFSPTKGPAALTWPGAAMLLRWAELLGVDPGSFLRPRREKE